MTTTDQARSIHRRTETTLGARPRHAIERCDIDPGTTRSTSGTTRLPTPHSRGLLAWIAALTITLPFAAAAEESKSKPGAAASDKLPEGFFIATEPPDAKNVLQVKKDAKEGDTIVVRGRIGGSKSPFVEKRAIFTLADMDMPPCGAKVNDGCKTPWDYCCEPKSEIVARTLTVQVLGADGKPLKIELNGTNELKPLAEVVIQGKVSKKSEDGKILTVDAAAIFVKKT